MVVSYGDLQNTFLAVTFMADEVDDEIKSRFGGKIPADL